MREPGWVQHCDSPDCSLGTFVYTCPKCGKDGTDYADAWFDQDTVFAGGKVEFECEHCRCKLVVFMRDYTTFVQEPSDERSEVPDVPTS